MLWAGSGVGTEAARPLVACSGRGHSHTEPGPRGGSWLRRRSNTIGLAPEAVRGGRPTLLRRLLGAGRTHCLGQEADPMTPGGLHLETGVEESLECEPPPHLEVP